MFHIYLARNFPYPQQSSHQYFLPLRAVNQLIDRRRNHQGDQPVNHHDNRLANLQIDRQHTHQVSLKENVNSFNFPLDLYFCYLSLILLWSVHQSNLLLNLLLSLHHNHLPSQQVQ
jgi:hypothetical protein